MKFIIKKSAFFLIIALLAISCTSRHDKEITKITKIENQIMHDVDKIDTAKLIKLSDMYMSFIEKYPKDSLNHKYLFKAITLNISLNRSKEAIQYIDKFLNEYSGSPMEPDMIFMKAFVYENLLSDYGKAVELYNIFINRFSNHEFIDDAKAAVNNIGKTPEELVKEFESEN